MTLAISLLFCFIGVKIWKKDCQQALPAVALLERKIVMHSEKSKWKISALRPCLTEQSSSIAMTSSGTTGTIFSCFYWAFKEINIHILKTEDNWWKWWVHTCPQWETISIRSPETPHGLSPIPQTTSTSPWASSCTFLHLSWVKCCYPHWGNGVMPP